MSSNDSTKKFTARVKLSKTKDRETVVELSRDSPVGWQDVHSDNNPDNNPDNDPDNDADTCRL